MNLETIAASKRVQSLVEENYKKLLVEYAPGSAMQYKLSFQDLIREVAQGTKELQAAESIVQERFKEKLNA